MKKSIRLALLSGACFLGLAVAAPAFSAYDPELIMEQSSYKLGSRHDGRRVHRDRPGRRSDRQADDLLAGRLQRQPDGARPARRSASVVARVKAKALGGALLTLAGDVVVANPARSDDPDGGSPVRQDQDLAHHASGVR